MPSQLTKTFGFSHFILDVYQHSKGKDIIYISCSSWFFSWNLKNIQKKKKKEELFQPILAKFLLAKKAFNWDRSNLKVMTKSLLYKQIAFKGCKMCKACWEQFQIPHMLMRCIIAYFICQQGVSYLNLKSIKFYWQVTYSTFILF